jgi:hypothetical protein
MKAVRLLTGCFEPECLLDTPVSSTPTRRTGMEEASLLKTTSYTGMDAVKLFSMEAAQTVCYNYNITL